MKRVGMFVFYVISAMAIAYLALYAYALYHHRDFTPGEPIRIFRNPDAPSYSSTMFSVIARSDSDEAIHLSACSGMDCFATLAMTTEG